MDQGLLLQIAIGAAGLIVGLGAGFALRRPDRRLTERMKALEGDLQDARQRYDRHRAQVEKHFERTSDLFRDLTEQYTQLYSHLAKGARELCPEGGPALGRGLDDPLLAETLGARAAAAEEGAPGAAAETAADEPEPRVDDDLSGDSADDEEKTPESGSR
jgi:uncharacterized membrane-anchored protein YhcB (DUF1043 family)